MGNGIILSLFMAHSNNLLSAKNQSLHLPLFPPVPYLQNDIQMAVHYFLIAASIHTSCLGTGYMYFVKPLLLFLFIEFFENVAESPDTLIYA